MATKSLLARAMYFARDLRSRRLFQELRRYVEGSVLDVGGWDFYLTARRKGVGFRNWTTLEYSRENLLQTGEPGVHVVLGDGCRMPFGDGQFDSLLNIQVLEHVFDPMRMTQEIQRVLKPGGYAVMLIPCTSAMHFVPYHYYNFTRFWIQEAMKRAGLEIVKLEPLGGIWSSMASQLVYFFLQSARVGSLSTPECRRNAAFYLLFPVMAAYALASIPICMFLSLGDLSEGPNNHLVVVRKPVD